MKHKKRGSAHRAKSRIPTGAFGLVMEKGCGKSTKHGRKPWGQSHKK